MGTEYSSTHALAWTRMIEIVIEILENFVSMLMFYILNITLFNNQKSQKKTVWT